MISAQIFSLLKHYFDKFHGLVLFWPGTLFLFPPVTAFSNTLPHFGHSQVFVVWFSTWKFGVGAVWLPTELTASRLGSSLWCSHRSIDQSSRSHFICFVDRSRHKPQAHRAWRWSLAQMVKAWFRVFFTVGRGMHFFKRVTVEFGFLSQLYNISNVSVYYMQYCMCLRISIFRKPLLKMGMVKESWSIRIGKKRSVSIVSSFRLQKIVTFTLMAMRQTLSIQLWYGCFPLGSNIRGMSFPIGCTKTSWFWYLSRTERSNLKRKTS